ncbi:MAG: hypothetical protein LBR36_05620 [Bacteroidales bacterium]|nr:hypothetical protein [Bacteroidales bacterium]
MTDITEKQFRVIKSDLMEQGIIREVQYGKTKQYEFITHSQPLDTHTFKELREAKLKDLDKMLEYVETTDSRMKFLCDYLGDNQHVNFLNCDNTGQKKIHINVTPELTEELQNFRENNFPDLEVNSLDSCIVDGVAASYYGVSNVGKAIHQSKYEAGGDFPDFLLRLTIKAFRKKIKKTHFDLILYVPPTKSGDLVKNFAQNLSHALKIPISHDLIKIRKTKEQKIFENQYLKQENIHNAFSYANPSEIKGKTVLLFDDIVDSGATIKEIGNLLTQLGAQKIVPVCIAKTVGGDRL